MTNDQSRRSFLAKGTAAAGAFVAGAALGHAQETSASQTLEHVPETLSGTKPYGKTLYQGNADYPRTQPGTGGPVGTPTDRGKLVPGLRQPGLPPVSIQTPDLDLLSWEMVKGAKEFHLFAEPVRQELLPGFFINTYGYNGSMPGPTIEVNQGDRVRIVVHNNLPEPTTMHLHGFELPNNMDGVPHLVQDLIEPGQEFAYELTVHQEGTFFYHSHVGMQETMGMVGLFIVHPAQPHLPVVDRDFGLIAQEFQIRPLTTVPDTLAMEWNYLTFNGRCGPLTTPLLCKLGERVRIRFVNFSVIDHHPLHFHGHTFWVTGTEGGRMPEPSWYPSNNVLVGVAQAREVEFIANNPGDWILHCHMFHHMMNSMTSQAGPLVRNNSTAQQMKVPGYPQIMLGMEMPGMKEHDMKNMPQEELSRQPRATAGMEKMQHETHSGAAHGPLGNNDASKGMARVEGRREAMGMRPGWSMGVEGLATVVRVLPPEMFEKIVGETQQRDH